MFFSLFILCDCRDTTAISNMILRGEAMAVKSTVVFLLMPTHELHHFYYFLAIYLVCITNNCSATEGLFYLSSI